MMVEQLIDFLHVLHTAVVQTFSSFHFFRRMFPTFKVSLTGLDPTSKYIVYMDVVPVDNHRYKYHNSQWMITGAAEPHSKLKNLKENSLKTSSLIRSAGPILSSSG